MTSRTCVAWLVGALAGLFAAPAGSAGELASWRPQMSWRIERGEAAPWATAQPADRPDRDSHALGGSIVRLEGIAWWRRIRSPARAHATSSW